MSVSTHKHHFYAKLNFYAKSVSTLSKLYLFGTTIIIHSYHIIRAATNDYLIID